MTIYGNTTRVSVDVGGGGITGVTGGDIDKAVIFARGDPASGTASVNDPTQVTGQAQAEEEFGEGSELAEYLKQVSNNGVDYGNMWGVMPEEVEVLDEDITNDADAQDHTNSQKISEGPIVEDPDAVTVEDDTGSELEVIFKYETNTDTTNSDFTSLSPDTDQIYINPNTREWVADDADNYSITYTYLDWESAFDSAENVIEEQESGEWGVATESQSVFTNLETRVNNLRRNEWKMIRVFGLAEVNETGDDGGAQINTSDFTLSVDNGATFLFGPGRIDGERTSVIGATVGIGAGNEMDNPIIGERLLGIAELEQSLSVPLQEDLAGEGVIPLSNAGNPSIEGNTSTSSEVDWRRTFFSRRLADYLILAARATAKAARGRLNNENTESIVEQQVSDEIIDLIDDGVLSPNVEDERRWFVNAEQDDDNSRELDVSFGFTPTGVVDIVDVSATINY